MKTHPDTQLAAHRAGRRCARNCARLDPKRAYRFYQFVGEWRELARQRIRQLKALK